MADAQVAAVREDPAARLALPARLFLGPRAATPAVPTGGVVVHALAGRRGVLDPLGA